MTAETLILLRRNIEVAINFAGMLLVDFKRYIMLKRYK